MPHPHAPSPSEPSPPEPGATHASAETLAPTPRPAWQRHLPNALTLARVALAAVFVALLSFWDVRINDRADAARLLYVSPDAQGSVSVVLLISMAIFILAAITDAGDGYFARRWKVISRFGRVMDPFADKALVLAAFIVLAGPQFRAQGGLQVSGVFPWMAIVILARELLVTTIRGVYEAEGIDFSAGWAGKWKMILQSIVIPGVLLLLGLGLGVPDTLWRWVIDISVWLTVLVTIWSGIPYVTKAIRAGRELDAPAKREASR